MAQLQIHRAHPLGLAGARERARVWVVQAERDWGLACDYQTGDAEDLVRFGRTGVSGLLRVNGQCFELEATLGFLLSAYRGRIQSHIEAQLDELLGPQAA